jgi:hypothetical protein
VSLLSLKKKEILDRPIFGGVLRTIVAEPRTFLDIGCENRYLDVFANAGSAKIRSTAWSFQIARPKKFNSRGTRPSIAASRNARKYRLVQ